MSMLASAKKILLGHGSGGRLTCELIREVFLPFLGNPILKRLTDAAVLESSSDKLVFTTDAFVVSPLFFPGGDIGKLAVCGSINDLVVMGAYPQYLSFDFILEEGLDYGTLKRIVRSIAGLTRKLNVPCVCADTKVVEKGCADKIFIAASGLGRLIKSISLGLQKIAPKDKIIVSGPIGEHGMAILDQRNNFGFKIKSDCACLTDLLLPILKKNLRIKFMRDPTRGGLATTLNEIAEATGLAVMIEEKNIPVKAAVKTACELLGIEPWYLACEGRAVIVADEKDASKVLELLRRHPLGRKSRIIGEIGGSPKGKVIVKTTSGGRRILDMLTSEPFPRIC